MSLTFDVSHDEVSGGVVIARQPENMLPISVTFDVSHNEVSGGVVMAQQPENM